MSKNTTGIAFGTVVFVQGSGHDGKCGLADLSGGELKKMYNELAFELSKPEVNRFSDQKTAQRRVWEMLQAYAAAKPETQMKGDVRAEDAPHPAIKSVRSEPAETPEAKKARLAEASAKAIAEKPTKAAPVAAPKAPKAPANPQAAAQAALRNSPPASDNPAKDAEMPALRKAVKPLNLAPKKTVYARRAGSKQAILVDMLSRPEGATFGELYDALAASGKPWRGVTIRSGLAWDINHIAGYGVTSELLDGLSFAHQGRTYEAHRLGVDLTEDPEEAGGFKLTDGYDPDLKLAVYRLTYPAGMTAPVPHTTSKKEG